MAKRRVYLVPGFLGFTSLGGLSYFHEVAPALTRALETRGVAAEVVSCPTVPAGSIARRADRLRRFVLETGCMEVDELHFVGHSTGGLDARLLLSPGVRLAEDRSEERIAKRTRNVLCIATPHHGSPLASYFATVQGRHILFILSVLASSAQGRAALYLAGRGLSALARLDDLVGRDKTFLDELANRLLRQLSHREDDPAWAYVREISADQGAALQLLPESMHLFNAAVVDHPSVAYGCVVGGAPQPPFAYRLRDLWGPGRFAMAGLFSALHTLASRMPARYPYPSASAAQQEELAGGLGFAPDTRANDGIVPVLSQLRGRIVHAARADHLDVVGQFWRTDEPMSDWLPSGAHFDTAGFERLWGAVAETIAEAPSTGP